MIFGFLKKSLKELLYTKLEIVKTLRLPLIIDHNNNILFYPGAYNKYYNFK